MPPRTRSTVCPQEIYVAQIRKQEQDFLQSKKHLHNSRQDAERKAYFANSSEEEFISRGIGYMFNVAMNWRAAGKS
jgi:hypothetical protein